MIPTDSINSFFSSLLPRICLLGSKLLASTSYHECSRNDTLLSQAYGNDEQFWQSNPLSYMNGVPGITSDSFVGEYLTKINLVFKRGPEIKENITWKDYRLIRDLTKLLRRRQRERLLKRNCCYEQNNNSALATPFSFISLPSLHNYNVKWTNFKLTWERERRGTRSPLFSSRLGIREKKFQRMGSLYFSVTFLLASPLWDLVLFTGVNPRGGAGGNTQESFIWQDSSPRSNPLP